MIVHVLLAFVVCASLCTEFRACAFDDDRYEQELALFPTGLSMYDGNGQLVELTRDRQPSSHLKVRSAEEKVFFTLYANQRPTEGQKLVINDTSSLRKSDFNSSKTTYIITHGWMNNGSSPSCVRIRDAYLANTDSNVIVIDWGSYSMSINYIDVTYKVKGVGKRVKKFIEWLYEHGLKADNLTLIGHSLGAHVVGIAGYKLTPQVKNIVGLDPALPMFNFAGEGESLTRKDAKHVQIIHTSAGILGYYFPNGDSDFYPNGGSRQPGCPDGFVAKFACFHDSAYVYFAESISKKFVGTACYSYDDFKDDDCGKHPEKAVMGGLNLTFVRSATYYLRTEKH